MRSISYFYPLHLLLLLTLGTAACTNEAKEECTQLISAIEQLQSFHVSAPNTIDATAFLNAQNQLLSQYGIEPNKNATKDLQRQCLSTAVALERFAATSKEKNKHFALELLNLYLHAWDPHSGAVSKQTLWAENGFESGFGFSIERVGLHGVVQVVDVIAGSPASEAGLQEGMLITKVNGKPVAQVGTTTLSNTLSVSNAQADPVTLAVQWGTGEDAMGKSTTQEILLTPGTFELAPVRANFLKATDTDHHIAYIKLRHFAGARVMFAEMLNAAKIASVLILDLRDVSGGKLKLAAEIADLLVANTESFVGFVGANSKQNQEPLTLTTPGSLWDGPIVVLVNGRTKSSAEVLAGALQDFGAIVVGTRTFGKGTEQRVESLSRFGLEGKAYITDAFTIRPSGKVIQLNGIVPDVKISTNEETKREFNYSQALFSPTDQIPLPNYDPSAWINRSKLFRAELMRIETNVRTLNTADRGLEAAKQVASSLIKFF